MREDKKILFMGTPDFAANSLKCLVESGYNVIGVFTNKDKPYGRGMKLKYSEVKEYAISKNIPVFQPAKLRNNEEVMEIIKKLNPDLIAVVAYGKILPSEIINYPKYGCVNVHGSLLPKYRGAAPIQYAIINGEKTTGVTTMYMDEGMDTGDMLLKSEIPIQDNDNYETLHDKLKVIGGNLLVETLDKIFNGSIKREKQNDDDATYTKLITKDMTKIDFNKTAKEIYDFVRGLNPFPCTYIKTDDKRYKIYEVEVVDENDMKINNITDKFKCGEVCFVSKKKLYIKCLDTAISIKTIQPTNSKRMDISAFLAGNSISVGTIFK